MHHKAVTVQAFRLICPQQTFTPNPRTQLGNIVIFQIVCNLTQGYIVDTEESIRHLTTQTMKFLLQLIENH
jgi:hypothetical protein